MRADNAAYKAGFASTRPRRQPDGLARSPYCNGKRITTPSYHLKKGDVLVCAEGSRKGSLFANLVEAKAEFRSSHSGLDRT